MIDATETGRVQIEMTRGYVSALALRMTPSGLISTITVGQPGYSTAGTTALFSPDDGVTQRIISEINNAQVSIDIAMYSFTSNGIREALVSARNRGVAIRIIADSSQASGPGSEVPFLEGAGFQIKRSAGGSDGIMHNKYMIIDRRTLFTGSFNWSASAEENNYENAIFIQASPVVQKYIDDFYRIWVK
jgi:phosphatidylserine/phosphatidylglycerophosphate/cardiolipin synthase-like enzyme